MLDSRDIQILNILQENSRATASDISKVIKLAIPTVSDRIKRLNEKWNYTDAKERVLRFDIQRTSELLNG